jgi:hypothetical protein
MTKFLKFWLPLIIVIVSVAGTAAIIHNRPEEQKPALFRLVEEKISGGEDPSEGGEKSGVQKFLDLVDQKIKSIITPNAPIGNLTPVRDLRGTWKSSLAGKGFQVYGKLATGPGTTTIYEEGDIELVIDSVANNVASGKIRYTNMCVTVQSTAPNIKPVTVKNCSKDSGYLPMAIRVSGALLDFGSVSAGGASFSMQGSYTTDLIKGNMTVNLPPHGVLKGEFHLIRKQS